MILDKTFAVLKKDLLNAVRYRTGLVFNVIAPAAQLATFYYLARAVGPQFRPDGMPYLPFLLVGTGFYTFLLAGMHSFVRIIQEAQQTGTLEVLMTTSTRPSMLLLLSAISALAGALVQLVIYVGGGMLLFDSVPRVNLPGGVAVFVLSALSALAVGVLAAGLQVSVQKGSAALWLLGSGAWLLAGTLFPVGALPAPVQIVSSFLPFTHALIGMRLALFQPANAAAVWHEAGVLALFSLALVPASILFFSWTVRCARQSGTLSFY